MTESNRRGQFELVFAGGTKRRYRRWHETFNSACATAYRVLQDMTTSGDYPRAAHPAIVYGPNCGHDGITIA